MEKYGAGITITGEAGTALAIDPKGIHKGEAPKARPRLLLGIQYSLLPPMLYDYRPVPNELPVGSDPYINRLIVEASTVSSSAKSEISKQG